MVRHLVSGAALAASLALVPATMPLAHAASAHAAATKKVVIKEVDERYRFTPKTITVKKGTKVVWTNGTDVEHNVTVKKGVKIDKDIEDGKKASFTFTKKGTFQYHCEYHPYMTGTVVVK